MIFGDFNKKQIKRRKAVILLFIKHFNVSTLFMWVLFSCGYSFISFNEIEKKIRLTETYGHRLKTY